MKLPSRSTSVRPPTLDDFAPVLKLLGFSGEDIDRLMTAARAMKRCDWCQKLFIPKPKTQRFCPKPSKCRDSWKNAHRGE